MVTFFVCLVLLIVGFFTYSKLVEKIFRIDDRPTPAVAHPDGVDYVPMKTWRIFLVQLLNIAGLGPIYGALSGACWGPVVYLWIVFGTILGGGVHDFLSGMMSERNDGKSISEVVGLYMGKVITFIMRVFSVVLLVMVGVNFSVGPAGLLAKLTPDMLGTMFWLVVIMVYYLIATFLPIDKIIGKLYPVFGICLIIMALGIGGAIVLTRGSDMPELTAAAFTVVHPDSLPKWSMMFVTVACGAISGFHATQSPMMARCITSEKQGRTIFYGAMVAEGVIALIWAAAGVTFYTNHGSLLDGMTGRNARGYYLSSLANQGLGNRIDALQDARRAVQLDPGNTEYQMHLRRMQNPGQTYRTTQATYTSPGGLMQWCWSMILLNLLCNCCCGGWGFHFRM